MTNPLTHSAVYDAETRLWLDRQVIEIESYVDSLASPSHADLRERLLHWAQFGYVIAPGLVEHELIDAYLADVEDLLTERNSSTMIRIGGLGDRPARELRPEEFTPSHARVMDFHNASVAGKRLALHPGIVSFLGHIFRETIVAMQSLTFIEGTEQLAHQDHAFVVAGIPTHLAATWIALEDVHPDAGPLSYYPGSHTIRPFDFGNGPFLTAESTLNEIDFAAHIEAECRRMGLNEEFFLPKKGDVLFWHAMLAHGGSPIRETGRTRRSFVTHYSTATGYPRDRRNLDAPPIVLELNGGLVYGDPRHPEEEDSFRRGDTVAPSAG